MNHRVASEVFQSPAREPVTYERLLSGLGDRDRATLERYVSAYEEKLGERAAERWRGLACALMTLAPTGVKLAGPHVMQFYVPDGPYRKQVFVLQALVGGGFSVYAPDVIEEAVAAGMVTGNLPLEDATTYHLAQNHGKMAIEAIDGKTSSLDGFCKGMTGWNRKAMRMTVPAHASDDQINATKQLCALAAMEWTTA